MTSKAIMVGTLAALALLTLSHAASQEPSLRAEEAEREFLRGVEAFREERFEAALDAFERVSAARPSHKRATAAAIMKAKTLLRLRRDPEAAAVLREFLRNHPTSLYTPDAEYMLGLASARVHRVSEALDDLLSAWRRLPATEASPLARNIPAAIEMLVREHLDIPAVEQLLARQTGPRSRSFLWMLLAEMHLAGGNVAAAMVSADTVERRYPGNPYAERVTRVRQSSAPRTSVKLGVLLPLMRSAEPSAVKEIGNDVHDGILLAADEYQARPDRIISITLVERDTERDPARAAGEVMQLAADRDVVGILGPVFSHTTLVAAEAARQAAIPLITPTANANGIAAAGPLVFQANPDYENRGRAMAAYAVQRLGLSTFGVLAPTDAHGRAMAEAFIAEAQRLGTEVAAAEWYQKGTTDLTQQLGNIRRASLGAAVEPAISFSGRLNQGDLAKLVQVGVPRRVLDSLVERAEVVSASTLLGPRARHLIDSLGIGTLSPVLHVDSLEIPAEGIQAVYIPIGSPAEIGVVASQLVYFNIKAQMLGSGEWNDLSELTANQRYCRGVLFESDSYPDPSDPAVEEFNRRFEARFSRRPGKYTLYGYDAARLVLGLIGRGASTRPSLARALEGVAGYQGLHGGIDLTRRRVNARVNILRFDGDTMTRVDEVTVESEHR